MRGFGGILKLLSRSRLVNTRYTYLKSALTF
jgi:hypothetical protein